MNMEKAIEERGGVWRRQSVKELREAWFKAGGHSHFKQEYVRGKGIQRVLSTADRKEILEDKSHPEKARVRKAKGVLKIKRCELRR